MPRPIIRKGAKFDPVEVKSITKVGKFERSIVIMNDKQKVAFIKRLETIVRTSMEYKDYIKYLREFINMEECSFYKNVTNKYSKKISIEIHHEPFTLFDICDVILSKWLKKDWNLDPYLMAEEVMKLHYMNLVGLVPLSITVHQLVHDGKLFVPLQNVKGDFNDFIRLYEEFMSPELKSKIKAKKILSEEVVDTSVLDKKFIYLKVEGWELPSIVSEDLEESDE